MKKLTYEELEQANGLLRQQLGAAERQRDILARSFGEFIQDAHDRLAALKGYHAGAVSKRAGVQI